MSLSYNCSIFIMGSIVSVKKNEKDTPFHHVVNNFVIGTDIILFRLGTLVHHHRDKYAANGDT